MRSVFAVSVVAFLVLPCAAQDPSLADIQPTPRIKSGISASSLPAPPARLRVKSSVTKPITLEPTGIRWKKDLALGREQMVKTDQPMMLFVTAPSCQYCELMKETTFAQQLIVREINNKFTPVMINGRIHKEISDKLQIRMFPATAVVHPSGKVVEIAHGYKSPAEFLKYMAVARAKLKLELSRQQKSTAKVNNGTRNMQ